MFGVMVRNAYGLGVQAMCGGASLMPFFTAAWPTAEWTRPVTTDHGLSQRIDSCVGQRIRRGEFHAGTLVPGLQTTGQRRLE